MKNKFCNNCGKEIINIKPHTVIQKYCSSKCAQEGWRKNNVDKQKASYERRKMRGRRNDILRKFNITSIKYDKLFLAQQGKCKICGLKVTNGRFLCVDHNHKNNSIRGLLCGKCNTGLGQFKDSIYLLLKVIVYLILAKIRRH